MSYIVLKITNIFFTPKFVNTYTMYSTINIVSHVSLFGIFTLYISRSVLLTIYEMTTKPRPISNLLETKSIKRSIFKESSSLCFWSDKISIPLNIHWFIILVNYISYPFLSSWCHKLKWNFSIFKYLFSWFCCLILVKESV